MPNRKDPEHFDEVAASWQREYPGIDLHGFLMGAALIRIGKIIEQDLFRKCQEQFGISGAETGLLFALRRQGPPYAARPRNLTPILLITSGAVTKQIDRLEERSLVRRSPDPSSLNGQIISLTSEGLALVDRLVIYLAQHSVISEALAALPADMARTGEAFYHILIDHLQGQTERKGNRATAGKRPGRRGRKPQLSDS